MQNLNVGTHGGSLAINSLGQVAGYRFSIGDSNLSAFVWDTNAGITDIGLLLGNVVSIATGVNDAGLVVGYYQTSGGYYGAFAYTPTEGVRDLGALGPYGTTAAGVNSLGQVVGSSVDS